MSEQYKDANWLQRKYWDEELNLLEIGSLVGVCGGTIQYWMKKLNISRRKVGAQYGKKNVNWKGGKKRRTGGYVSILKPNHPRANKQGYIREHRLVMEEHLERYLEPWEIVHHKNRIKDDNRIENLELLPKQANHLAIQNLQKENLKWRRAFYHMVGFWLGNKRRAQNGQ